MPVFEEDIKQVQAARKKQAAAIKSLGQLSAGAITFPNEIMDRVRSARAARGVDTLATGLGETTGQLASEPAAMRARLEGVNPLQADVLAGRQRAQTLESLTTLAKIEEERTGTVQDIIGAGTDRINAMVEAKRAEAESANQEAQGLMEILRFKQDEAQRQFNQWLSSAKLSQDKDDEKGAAFAVMYNLTAIKDKLREIKSGRVGGPLAKVKSFFGLEPSYRELESLIAQTSPVIAREVLKLGRLSDKDIELAATALPSAKDKPEEIEGIVDSLLKTMEFTYGIGGLPEIGGQAGAGPGQEGAEWELLEMQP